MRTDGLTSMVQYAIGVFVFVYRLQNIISMVLLQMSFEKGLCWGIKLKATDFHQLKKYSGNTPPPPDATSIPQGCSNEKSKSSSIVHFTYIVDMNNGANSMSLFYPCQHAGLSSIEWALTIWL